MCIFSPRFSYWHSIVSLGFVRISKFLEVDGKVSYTSISVATGYEPKELIISFGDVHIYKNHIPQVKEQLSRTPRPLPELIVHKWEESEDALWNPLQRLLHFKYEYLELKSYDPYPTIKAEVAV